jgi:iron complex transport system substrate-binding protein
VLALNPDLVVMYDGVNPRLHANLERLKIPLLDVPWANSLADVRRITRLLGRRLGAVGKAETLLAEMDGKLAAARKRAPSPPVTAILYQPNGYAGTGAVVDELLASVGIRNVAPSLGPSPAGTVPVETVVAKAPELLIFAEDGSSGAGRAYQVLHHPALKALDGRTVRASANLTPLMCPGPWLADTAQSFGKAARQARALAKGTRSH